MKIDKVWLVAFITFIGGWLSKQFNLPLPDGYAEWASDASDAIIIIAGLVTSFKTMMKQNQSTGGASFEQDQYTIGDHGPMR